MSPSPSTQVCCPNLPTPGFEELMRFLPNGIYDTPQSLSKSMEISPLTSHGLNRTHDFKNLTGPKLQSLPGFLEVSVNFLPV